MCILCMSPSPPPATCAAWSAVDVAHIAGTCTSSFMTGSPCLFTCAAGYTPSTSPAAGIVECVTVGPDTWSIDGGFASSTHPTCDGALLPHGAMSMTVQHQPHPTQQHAQHGQQQMFHTSLEHVPPILWLAPHASSPAMLDMCPALVPGLAVWTAFQLGQKLGALTVVLPPLYIQPAMVPTPTSPTTPTLCTTSHPRPHPLWDNMCADGVQATSPHPSGVHSVVNSECCSHHWGMHIGFCGWFPMRLHL